MERIDELPTRNGIIIEKGIVLAQPVLEKNQELVRNYLNYWMLYPDLLT